MVLPFDPGKFGMSLQLFKVYSGARERQTHLGNISGGNYTSYYHSTSLSTERTATQYCVVATCSNLPIIKSEIQTENFSAIRYS